MTVLLTSYLVRLLLEVDFFPYRLLKLSQWRNISMTLWMQDLSGLHHLLLVLRG